MTASARHTASYYAASSVPQPDYPTLTGEVNADVCVIGGGFSGLNTALELSERGFRVVLLEARKIGWGASGRNGGQLIRGVGHGLDQFTQVIGSDGVRTGYDIAQLRAVRARCAVPLVASGGAGEPAHFEQVFNEADVDAALAASVFHSGSIAIPALKRYLREHGIEVRQ